jgi:AraC family transcriptional regulator, arabinose operon regulatory protein
MLERSCILARPLDLLSIGGRVDPRVQRTIERMEADLSDRVTVADLAGAVELSVAQLTRLFRASTGHTPAAFLHTLRMRRALQLVRTTSMPVGEIMSRVGISDRSHFARTFRRTFGFSPRTLRVQLRGRRASIDKSAR